MTYIVTNLVRLTLPKEYIIDYQLDRGIYKADK
jgi:hypothetical protein